MCRRSRLRPLADCPCVDPSRLVCRLPASSSTWAPLGPPVLARDRAPAVRPSAGPPATIFACGPPSSPPAQPLTRSADVKAGRRTLTSPPLALEAAPMGTTTQSGRAPRPSTSRTANRSSTVAATSTRRTRTNRVPRGSASQAARAGPGCDVSRAVPPPQLELRPRGPD